MNFNDKLASLHTYFHTGNTLPHEYRKAQLLKLKEAIKNHEENLYAALDKDLKKSKEEAWVTEIGFVLEELKTTLKNLRKWMKPKRVGTNLLNLPGRSRIYNEPLGLVLIISPWNYPVNLLFTPLIGAIAAGNCVVLKSSEAAPATSTAMRNIIEEIFPENYILFVEGEGSEVVPAMMEATRFDHIFYTGSTAVGKKVYEAAAKKLIPVTLELGGKSPCIVEEDADIKVAAKRIAFAKFSNSGQTCVAPDYILVAESKRDELIQDLKHSIVEFFGDQPHKSYDYGKIINKEQYDRLTAYLQQGTVVHGGTLHPDTLQIDPTILTDVQLHSDVMQEEIFGPILPVIPIAGMHAGLEVIKQNANPLAFYLFTGDKKKKVKWLQSVPFGGGCINNASVHLLNDNLPFGGRGDSGIGHYHGRYSFDVFSHKKSVLRNPTWFDPKIKYPSYEGKLSLLKKVIG